MRNQGGCPGLVVRGPLDLEGRGALQVQPRTIDNRPFLAYPSSLMPNTGSSEEAVNA